MENINERLISVLDMVISRLDSLGCQMSVVEAKLDSQNKGQCHADSLRPLGVPFSGMAMLGNPVTLTVHTKFDEGGVFDTDNGYNSFLVVIKGTPLKCFRQWDTSGGYTLTEETAARAAWGDCKYEQVMSGVKEWFTHNPGSWEGPQCSELGIQSSHPFLHHEICEVTCRHLSPSLRAVGRESFMVNADNLNDVYNITKNLIEPYGGLVTWLEIHDIEYGLELLAKAHLRQVAGKEQEAWAETAHGFREMIRDGKHSYFTKAWLAKLLG